MLGDACEPFVVQEVLGEKHAGGIVDRRCGRGGMAEPVQVDGIAECTPCVADDNVVERAFRQQAFLFRSPQAAVIGAAWASQLSNDTRIASVTPGVTKTSDIRFLNSRT